jgi:predicted GNAT family acetyltransferase
MAWRLTDSVADFLAGAGDFLRARPVHNTALLTVSDTVRERGPGVYGDAPPRYGWCPAGAFLHTPPHPVLLSDMSPADATELAALLVDTPLTGVTAPDPVARAFAAEWHRLTGATTRVAARLRLFRLAALVPPSPPAPGKARVAEARDRDLLIDWMCEFQRQIGETPDRVGQFVDDKLAYGGISLWEHDGRPVSMVVASREQAGTVRVMVVYTPREYRARGYAGVATAVVSQAALDAGASDVVLFTDLTNPTSNALYQRLGYTAVEDRSLVEFTS